MPSKLDTSALNRVIIVHNILHMRHAFAAAVKTNRPLILQSACGAIRFAGAEYLKECFAQAQLEHPAVDAHFIIDCDDAGAFTIQAMRMGHAYIRSNAPSPLKEKLFNIAQKLDVVVADGAYESLDLIYEYDAYGACMKWLNIPI